MEGWYNVLAMRISNMQKVFPLSSLHVIIIGTTFRYFVSASEANLSIFKCTLSMQALCPG